MKVTADRIIGRSDSEGRKSGRGSNVNATLDGIPNLETFLKHDATPREGDGGILLRYLSTYRKKTL